MTFRVDRVADSRVGATCPLQLLPPVSKVTYRS